MHDWQTARDGYDTSKNPRMLRYRRMTVQEAQSLTTSHIAVLSHDGVLRRAKVNGRAKVWKTNPERVRVPVKYGLYECFYLEDDGSGFVTYGVVLEDGAHI
jgi:hypothetical protein